MTGTWETDSSQVARSSNEETRLSILQAEGMRATKVGVVGKTQLIVDRIVVDELAR
jgi:hypothetical protein